MGTLESLPAWRLEVDVLPVGVCLLDATGRIEETSQIELDLLGLPRERVVGRQFDAFHADPAKGAHLLARLLAGEALTREPADLRGCHGEVLDVVIDAHPLVEDGTLRGVRCFTRDVREERRAERARSEHDAVVVAEKVRRRIGHDLHDGLSQVLIGAALLAHRVGERAPAELSADTARLREILNEAAARVQSIARGLALLRVDALTAGQALHHVAKEASSTLRIDVDVVVDPAADRQPEQTTQQLCLIAQEAVRNAWRHGRASRVEIRLQAAGGSFTLSIEDDGAGIAPDAPVRGVGLGGGTLVRCTWSGGRDSSERPVIA